MRTALLLLTTLPLTVLSKAPPLTCGLESSDKTVTCPKISDINYNKTSQVWETKSGWKSTEGTLSGGIKRFVGAQWIGYQTGQIVCVYGASAGDEFPVALSAAVTTENPLMQKPQTPLFRVSKWVEESKNAFQIRLNCISESAEPCDCPFEVFSIAERSTAEIIQSIKKITGGDAVFEYQGPY